MTDTLTFSRFQTFNFHGWNDTPELLEPLLFYVLHRAKAMKSLTYQQASNVQDVPARRSLAVHSK